MNPVPIIKLVEIIKGDKTSPETLGTIKKLSEEIDKIPIECNDSPGFVSNRILMPMINEAAYCCHEGVADTSSIDSITILALFITASSTISLLISLKLPELLSSSLPNSRIDLAQVISSSE